MGSIREPKILSAMDIFGRLLTILWSTGHGTFPLEDYKNS